MNNISKNKQLHIPSKWNDNDIVKLLQFNYDTDSFQIMSELYKKISNSCIHDYLHFIIEDMLDKKNIPYISKKDIYNCIHRKIFQQIPDIVTINYETSKYLILDIYDKLEKQSIVDKITKKMELQLFFDYEIIHQLNIGVLKKLLMFDDDDIKYIEDNYCAFRFEYHYWTICINIGKIVKNVSKCGYDKNATCHTYDDNIICNTFDKKNKFISELNDQLDSMKPCSSYFV